MYYDNKSSMNRFDVRKVCLSKVKFDGSLHFCFLRVSHVLISSVNPDANYSKNVQEGLIMKRLTENEARSFFF